MRISDWSSDVCSSDLEDAEQIVVEAEVEFRQARVALTSRTAAQLVVDAAAFVTLGRQHEQPARGQHRLALGFDLGLDPRDTRLALGPFQIGRASCRERGGQYV